MVPTDVELSAVREPGQTERRAKLHERIKTAIDNMEILVLRQKRISYQIENEMNEYSE